MKPDNIYHGFNSNEKELLQKRSKIIVSKGSTLKTDSSSISLKYLSHTHIRTHLCTDKKSQMVKVTFYHFAAYVFTSPSMMEIIAIFHPKTQCPDA